MRRESAPPRNETLDASELAAVRERARRHADDLLRWEDAIDRRHMWRLLHAGDATFEPDVVSDEDRTSAAAMLLIPASTPAPPLGDRCLKCRDRPRFQRYHLCRECLDADE